MEDEEQQGTSHLTEIPELEVMEQVEVSFLDVMILATLGADGDAYIPVRPFCIDLGLAKPDRQLDRIRADDTLHAGSRKMRIKTPGGPQTLVCLRVDMLAIWLVHIRESMCKENVRPRLSAYKREAAKAIIEHFRALAVARKSSAVVPATPTQPVELNSEGTLDEVVAYHEAMMRYHQAQRDLALWKAQQEAQVGQIQSDLYQVKAEVADLKRITALVPEIVTQYRNRSLSDAHQATVAACVKRLHDLTGRSQAAIYEDLKFTFRVAKYDRIADARWSEVAKWLFERIHTAGGKTDDLENEQGSLFGG